MKKILCLSLLLAISCGASFAATSNFGKSLKNAVKSDLNAAKSNVKQTNSDLKNAIKADLKNKAQEKAGITAEKKAEKIKMLNAKLAEAKTELANVKANKTITETERTMKTKILQNRIDAYEKQINALK